MNNPATMIKEARIRKGITQQELADLAGVSLRSVQRIENDEVKPRAYTLRIIASQLGLPELILQRDRTIQDADLQNTDDKTPAEPVFPVELQSLVRQSTLNTAQKILLSIGIAVLLIMVTLAFIFQSPHFPETAFETILLWIPIVIIYVGILFRLWRNDA